MCLILFSYDQHPEYRLILAANRDEFLERPTRPAAFWDDYPELLAGKDVRAGGTWMGITRAHRFAAITNYRDHESEMQGAPSRGHLVSDFLKGDASPEAYLTGLEKDAGNYNGFNLLVGDIDGLYYFSNREGAVRRINAGIHGLSNHLLNTPWPKVERGKAKLAAAVASKLVAHDDLMTLLADHHLASDEELPQTGVPIEWERMLSSMFIKAPNYGTRASTVLLIDREGAVTFVEKTISLNGAASPEVKYSF